MSKSQRKSITYYDQEQTKKEEVIYYDDNHRPHREDNPATIRWFKNGQKEYEAYYEHGQLHRDNDKPASRKWFKDGTLKKKEFFKHNIHRRSDKGPIMIEWYNNGQKKKESYYSDPRHREDGPIYAKWDKDGQIQEECYYVHGEKISKEEFIRWKVGRRFNEKIMKRNMEIPDKVSILRDITGYGLLDCSDAYEAANGDMEKALIWLGYRWMPEVDENVVMENKDLINKYGLQKWLDKLGDYYYE